ncbi:hypothetical protein ACFTZB_10895 [Rhodococcus sp. NPDC057014]|uniref:hypothetical protein n=1 Tax=Rhodococcus sp. NPDC057014 TaxID=3346000 RepID=UPI003632EE44
MTLTATDATGPTAGPGRHVVLLVTSTVLAHLHALADFALTSRTTPDPDQPLPATFRQRRQS